ncbi:MAG: phosphoribosyltransferase [Nitrospirota bacterium]|nr:phosphoribosyltransferase [Nitrospirota bacterium]
MVVLKDREEAGRLLAERLGAYRDDPNALILALPRGGVAVGYTLSLALHLPLDVLIVRKLGAPGNPELAIGAVDDTTVLVIDRKLSRHVGVNDVELAEVAEHQREQLRQWLDGIGGNAVPAIADRTVLLADDGVATGYTAQAGVESVRRRGAARVVLAVPVAPHDTAEWLESLVDELVVLAIPEPFFAVGNFFEEWPQVTDDEVRSLLLAGNTL